MDCCQICGGWWGPCSCCLSWGPHWKYKSDAYTTGCCVPSGTITPYILVRRVLVTAILAAIVLLAIYLGFTWRSSRIEGGEYKAKKANGDGDEAKETDGGGK